MKTYSNASNARRAAKAANLVGFTIVKDGPGYTIQVAAPEPVKAPKGTAFVEMMNRMQPAAKVCVARAKALKAKRVAKAPAKVASEVPAGGKGAILVARVS